MEYQLNERNPEDEIERDKYANSDEAYELECEREHDKSIDYEIPYQDE